MGQAYVTNWGSFVLLKIRANVVINWGSYYKLGQPLLQNRAAITNWGKMYYKLGKVLQIRAVITNWGITSITKIQIFFTPEVKSYTDHLRLMFIATLSVVHSVARTELTLENLAS